MVTLYPQGGFSQAEHPDTLVSQSWKRTQDSVRFACSNTSEDGPTVNLNTHAAAEETNACSERHGRDTDTETTLAKLSQRTRKQHYQMYIHGVFFRRARPTNNPTEQVSTTPTLYALVFFVFWLFSWTTRRTGVTYAPRLLCVLLIFFLFK